MPDSSSYQGSCELQEMEYRMASPQGRLLAVALDSLSNPALLTPCCHSSSEPQVPSTNLVCNDDTLDGLESTGSNSLSALGLLHQSSNSSSVTSNVISSTVTVVASVVETLSSAPMNRPAST